MKTLIIGEIINNNLSSGTLEILGKAKSLDLDTGFRIFDCFNIYEFKILSCVNG